MTLHSKLELAIAKLLQDNSHSVAMISAGQRQPQMIELLALSPAPSIIRRDSNCLLLAREALVKSSSLTINVDYTVFDEERQLFVQKIGISAFLFAKKMSRPLYFVKLEINVDGEIVCTVRLSQSDEPENGIAEHFRSFVGVRAIPGDEFSIGDWFLDTKGNSNARIARRSPPG